MFFFSNCYVPNPKVHAKPPIWRNLTTLPEICVLSVFSLLSTKTINNKELTSIYESKTKLLETCLLSVLRRKTLKRMQTNQYQEVEKHYLKGIFWVFLSLTTKNRENWCKALNIRKQKDFARKVYNEFFIVQKNQKAKNTKTRVYGECS